MLGPDEMRTVTKRCGWVACASESAVSFAATGAGAAADAVSFAFIRSPWRSEHQHRRTFPTRVTKRALPPLGPASGSREWQQPLYEMGLELRRASKIPMPLPREVTRKPWD